MKQFKTAVIGIGFIGVAHVEALRRLGNVDVIAIVDPIQVEEKAERLSIPNAYQDYKELVKNHSLDFVHICTPNNTHFEIAKYMMEHHINVVLEKPLTMDVKEAKMLTEIAEKQQLINAVNFHNRFYPATAYMKNLIEKSEIGEVTSINGMYLQDWLLFETDYSWRLNTKESGKTRAVADIGSHWIDLVEYVTNLRVTKVFAQFKTVYNNRKKPKGPTIAFGKNDSKEFVDVAIDTEDIANVLFEFSNGAIGSVTISQVFAGKKNKIDVLISGTKKSLEWKLEEGSDVLLGNRDIPNQIITKDAILMSDVKDMIDFPAGHTEGFPDAFKQAFKSIYSGNKKYAAGFKDGLHQMIINEAIYQSAKQSKWIKLEEIE